MGWVGDCAGAAVADPVNAPIRRGTALRLGLRTPGFRNYQVITAKDLNAVTWIVGDTTTGQVWEETCPASTRTHTQS